VLNVLMFFGAILAGGISTFILSPVFAFVLYQAVYFFNPQNRWWGGSVPNISYSFFVVLFMAGVVALNYKKLEANKIFAAPQMKWLYMILVLILLTSFNAVYPEYHHQQQIGFLKLVIIMTLAYKLVSSEHDLNLIQWGYIFGCWYLSFVIFQVGRGASGRVEGIGTVDALDANMIAAALTPSLVLCLFFFWKSEIKIQKLLFAFAGVFIANGLVLINSRGAFLGLVCSILYFMFFLFFSSLQKKFQKATVVWMIIFGLAGTLYIADSSFIERMTNIVNNTEVDTEIESGGTRVYYWLGAWEMAKDYPLGTGISGFQYFAPFYIPESVETGVNRNRAVHSTWFEALSEFGYLGLFFLLMLLRSCYKSTSQCKKRFKEQKDINRYFQIVALEASLIAFVVCMTFINRFRAEVLYWLILFIACAYNIYIVKSDEKKD
jgi:hypothetical protein